MSVHARRMNDAGLTDGSHEQMGALVRLELRACAWNCALFA